MTATATTATTYFNGLTEMNEVSALFVALSREFSPVLVDTDPAFANATPAQRQAEKVSRQAKTLELNADFQTKVRELVPAMLIQKRIARGGVADDSFKRWAAGAGIASYTPLAAALGKIIHLADHAKIQIIGCWIYVFDYTDSDVPALQAAKFRAKKEIEENVGEIPAYYWAGSRPKVSLTLTKKRLVFGYTDVPDLAATA